MAWNPQAQKIYPITEIDASLGPGPFTINELAERFGEPAKLTGELVANGLGRTGGNVCGLVAEFEDVTFRLWDDLDGTRLSYNNEANMESTGTYEEFSAIAVPTNADKTLLLELCSTTVNGESIPLPRGIHVGDSIEKVKGAYPDAPSERTDEQGLLMLFYRYGTSQIEIFHQEGYDIVYGIFYCFEGDRLTSAYITWIDAFDRFD